MTAPSTALPSEAALTSGQPWMPTDSAESNGTEAATSTVSRTVRAAPHSGESPGDAGGPHSDRLRRRAELPAWRARRSRPRHAGRTTRSPPTESIRSRMLPSPPAPDTVPGSMPTPSSGTSMVSVVPTAVELDGDRGRGRVLDGVLHGLDTGEVQRGLDRAGSPTDSPVGHRDRDAAACSRLPHRRGETMVGERPRVDAPGEVDEGGDGRVDRVDLLPQHRGRPLG